MLDFVNENILLGTILYNLGHPFSINLVAVRLLQSLCFIGHSIWQFFNSKHCSFRSWCLFVWIGRCRSTGGAILEVSAANGLAVAVNNSQTATATIQTASGLGCHQTYADSQSSKSRYGPRKEERGSIESDIVDVSTPKMQIQPERDANTDATGNPLFQMKGRSKKEWKHVRLVAKKGTDMSSVKSKDAIKAFCLLCRMDITFSKGNGNSVYRWSTCMVERASIPVSKDCSCGTKMVVYTGQLNSLWMRLLSLWRRSVRKTSIDARWCVDESSSSYEQSQACTSVSRGHKEGSDQE